MMYPEIQRAAEQGDAEAQCCLGDIYYQGRDEFPRDAKKAVYWYRMAAEQGNADAQCQLGEMLLYGDVKEGFKWCRMAADQGHPGAQFTLGWMYEKGEDFPKDLSEAAEWYRKAAGQGYALASASLEGVMREMKREKSARNEYAKDEEEIQRRHKL